jgi:flagellar hook-associated protein 1 FlgK
MTGFSALNNAAQALAAQRYAIDVTGRNIANANTDGYTRERADVTATGGPAGVPRLHATANAASGTATVSGTSRLNDPVLDARARSEHATGSYLDTKSTTMNSIESLVDEPSDNGLAEQLSSFWNSWSGVQNNPGDTTARNAVLSSASSVVATLHSISGGLSDLAADTQTALTNTVAQINQAAQSVASLNAQIRIATATGSVDPAVLDQRDAQLNTLAQLGGATAAQQTDGTVTVTMGGQTLVSTVTAATVAVDPSNQVTVGGNTAALTGGTALAQSQTLTTTIPGYQAQLDSVAAGLASAVNSVHASGYDLSGAAGGAFFTGTTAATISVAITDPSKVAASATGSGTGDLDGSVAATLATLGSAATGPDATYRKFVTSLGSDVQSATQQSALQTTITSNVDTLQASVSGVNYDDEVTNLLTYQRAYQASSRVLTTIDDMLDTLINRTGRVGI